MAKTLATMQKNGSENGSGTQFAQKHKENAKKMGPEMGPGTHFVRKHKDNADKMGRPARLAHSVQSC